MFTAFSMGDNRVEKEFYSNQKMAVYLNGMD